MEVADRLWLTLCGEEHVQSSRDSVSKNVTLPTSCNNVTNSLLNNSAASAAIKIQAAFRGGLERSRLLRQCLKKIEALEKRHEKDILNLEFQLGLCEAKVAQLQNDKYNVVDLAKAKSASTERDNYMLPYISPIANALDQPYNNIWNRNSDYNETSPPSTAFSKSPSLTFPSALSSLSPASSTSSQLPIKDAPQPRSFSLHSFKSKSMHSSFTSDAFHKKVPFAGPRRVASLDCSYNKDISPIETTQPVFVVSNPRALEKHKPYHGQPANASGLPVPANTIKLQMPPPNGVKAKLARKTCATKQVDIEKQVQDALQFQNIMAQLESNSRESIGTLLERLKQFPESKATSYLMQLIKTPKTEQEQNYKQIAVSLVTKQLVELSVMASGGALIQRCLEFASEEAREELVRLIEVNLENLAGNQYSCYVVQKALEVASNQRYSIMVNKLLKLASADAFLNSPPVCLVWQYLFQINSTRDKSSSTYPNLAENLHVKLQGNWGTLAQSEHGSLVAQSVFENDTASLKPRELILNELLQELPSVAQSQWGFWVIHHLLNNGLPNEKSFLQQVILKNGNVLQKQAAGLKLYEQALS